MLGSALLLASIALALWNLFVWLRDGLWPDYPAAAMLADLGLPNAGPASWLGGAIDWLLAWSAAGLLAVLGLLLVVVGAMLNDNYSPEALAAAAARDKFRPATERERAASWGRAGREPPVAPTRDHEDEAADAAQDEALERKAAAQDAADDAAAPVPPQPSFGRHVVDSVLGLGCIVFLIVGGLGLFIGWNYFDRRHYDRVTARVASVETSCALEWPPPRDPGWWESAGARRSEEMACAEARPRVRGDNPRLIEIRTVTYSYTSPRDGRTYPGTIHADAVDLPPDVRAGGEMVAYSLKADPGRSRGIFGWPVD